MQNLLRISCKNPLFRNPLITQGRAPSPPPQHPHTAQPQNPDERPEPPRRENEKDKRGDTRRKPGGTREGGYREPSLIKIKPQSSQRRSKGRAEKGVSTFSTGQNPPNSPKYPLIIGYSGPLKGSPQRHTSFLTSLCELVASWSLSLERRRMGLARSLAP
jgi:hypothetical protein